MEAVFSFTLRNTPFCLTDLKVVILLVRIFSIFINQKIDKIGIRAVVVFFGKFKTYTKVE